MIDVYQKVTKLTTSASLITDIACCCTSKNGQTCIDLCLLCGRLIVDTIEILRQDIAGCSIECKGKTRSCSCINKIRTSRSCEAEGCIRCRHKCDKQTEKVIDGEHSSRHGDKIVVGM